MVDLVWSVTNSVDGEHSVDKVDLVWPVTDAVYRGHSVDKVDSVETELMALD